MALRRRRRCRFLKLVFTSSPRRLPFPPPLSPPAGRATEDLTPLRAHELLSAIPTEDLDLLWLDPAAGR